MGYAVDKMPGYIVIGRETESGVTEIRFDCTDWLEKWPGMTISLLAATPGGSVYPPLCALDGSDLVWRVTGADTAVPGEGRIELVGTLDGVRKVSATAVTQIKARMPGAAGDPPEPARPWVDEVTGAAARAEGSAQAAQTSAANAQSFAQAAQEAAEGVVTAESERAQAEQARAQAEHARQEAERAREEVLPSKLTEPAQGLAVGKYFRIAAIDSAGHAVLEAVDAPVGGVQDVLVDGASIVADGVVNVPIASDTEFGITRVGNGLGLSSDKKIMLSISNEDILSKRSLTYAAISPKHLDYAVRCAMCDGKGPAWTPEQQAASRKRLGLPGDYELIDEIICDGEASAYTRNVDPIGNPYDFESVYIEIEVQAGNTYTTVFIRANDESGKFVLYEGLPTVSRAYTSYICSGCYADRGFYRGWSINQNIASSNKGGSSAVKYNVPTPIVSPIKNVFININSGTFFDGDKIRIYGVRA